MPPLTNLLHKLDPETAHGLAIKALKIGVVPTYYQQIPDSPIKAMGLTFKHPVGMAAGFDKNGEAVVGLAKLGFSFIEVGTTTPLPQAGNEKPRLFRLTEDQAIINRLGFNNLGHAAMLAQLEKISPKVRENCLIGVNLGKNKSQDDAVKDYVLGVERFSSIADYLVVNISSPNTPHLRALQDKEPLYTLLSAVQEKRQQQPKQPPLVVKIAPDLTVEAIDDIAEIIRKTALDGVIVSNTTIQRPEILKSTHKAETGGLSGVPLKNFALEALKNLRPQLPETVCIIGVGGISTAEDVRERLGAGATLVQIYTSFIYQGIGVVRQLSGAWRS
jgi:dihydroorotate dehydrogenase